MNPQIQNVGDKGDFYLRGGKRSRTAKYNCKDVQEVRELHAAGNSYDQISELTGVPKQTVGGIIRRERYTNCKGDK